MSTTLHERPPQRVSEASTPHRTVRRPNALDRLALRVGLLLITYGRRSYAVSSDRLALRAETDRDREERLRRVRDLSWQRSQYVVRPLP